MKGLVYLKHKQLFQPSGPVAAWLNAQPLGALAQVVYKHTAEPSRQVPSTDQIVVQAAKTHVRLMEWALSAKMRPGLIGGPKAGGRWQSTPGQLIALRAAARRTARRWTHR